MRIASLRQLITLSTVSFRIESMFSGIDANDISKKEVGFNSDLNEVTIIDKNGKTQKIEKSSKKFVASLIAKKIVDTFLLNEKSLN